VRPSRDDFLPVPSGESGHTSPRASDARSDAASDLPSAENGLRASLATTDSLLSRRTSAGDTLDSLPAAVPSRLNFMREVSSGLILAPWSRAARTASNSTLGERQRRWLPPVFASETMAADVLTLIKDVVRASVRTPRGADVLEAAIQSLGCLETTGDARTGLPLNLVQTYGTSETTRTVIFWDVLTVSLHSVGGPAGVQAAAHGIP